MKTLKKYKRPLTLVTVSLFCLISFWFVLKLVLKNTIEDKIEKLEFYSFTISGSPEVKVRPFHRQISVNNIQAKGAGTNKMQFLQIRFTGIHIFSLLLKGELKVNKALIDNPEIFISIQTGNIVENKKADKESAMKVTVKKLEINNGRLILNKINSEGSDTIVSMQINTDVWDLNINSRTRKFVFQNHSFSRIRLSLTNCTYFFPNKLYYTSVKSFHFDSQDSNLSAHNLKLKSVHPKYEIAHVKGVETDWFNISLDSLSINKISLESLLNDSLLIVNFAEIDGLKLHSFRDKRMPFPGKADTKLPMQMINSLPVKLHADTVRIKNSYIDYEEHHGDADKPGIIKFYEVNATIANISNIDSLISGRTFMLASAIVMNESLLKSEFIFPNKRYPEKYNVSGTLQPIEIKTFNPMTIPVALIEVKSGRTKNLAFNFYYNNERSDGDMIFEYENLKIVLLNKKDNSKKEILSFFANAIVVRKNNLQSNKTFNNGRITFERDKKKSIFNYWWKSLLSGLKDSATI